MPPTPPHPSAADWTSVVADDWRAALAPVGPQLDALAGWLDTEADAGRAYLPPAHSVLRAFARPLAEVRVLIVGQDPYPTPGHSMGSRSRSGPTCTRCHARSPTSSPS